MSFFYRFIALGRPSFQGQVTRLQMPLLTLHLGLCALELGTHLASTTSCIPWISFHVAFIWLRHKLPERNKSWCKAIFVQFRHVRIATSVAVWGLQPHCDQDLNMRDHGLEFSISEIAISVRCHLFDLTENTIVAGSC